MTSDSINASHQTHLSHPKYRPDIDGLRAIAILSVVIYHAFPKFIKGGFIGVDIFFVISGFLISTIIISSLQRDNFSFIEFYSRRIKRIFPGLIVVLLACLSFGWIVLIADEYKQLGKHVAGGASFISNFLFWQESGYFDNSSETKPLLHLWSLGIEEQFYILWPICLWVGWKLRSNLFVIGVLIALISFILNVVKVPVDAIATFYAPQTRFWELLSGAILAYANLHYGSGSSQLKQQHGRCQWRFISMIDKSPCKNIQSLLGAALIFTALFLINKERQFPGWWALMPVSGAVLVISAGTQSWFNRVVLSSRVLVWIGLISYPLYLWHWPLLSFAWIIESNDPSRPIRFAAVIVSVVLAWFTYRFIEAPVRFGRQGNFKLIMLVLMMTLSGIAGYQVYVANGIPSRTAANLESKSFGDIGHDEFRKYTDEHSYPCTLSETHLRQLPEAYKNIRCRQSRQDKPIEMALIGDSHAEHLFIGLAESMPVVNVAYYAKIGMPYLSNPEFKDIFESVIEDKNIKMVILSAYWSKRVTRMPEGTNFESEFVETVDALIKANKKVYIAEDVPDFSFDPKKCKYSRLFSQAGGCEQNSSDFYKRYKNYYPVFEAIELKNEGAKILKTSAYFCDVNICTMAKNGTIFYRDNNHLNIKGSKYLAEKITENKLLDISAFTKQ